MITTKMAMKAEKVEKVDKIIEEWKNPEIGTKRKMRTKDLLLHAR